jgi:subtilisin-like proprotein convertase family protein
LFYIGPNLNSGSVTGMTANVYPSTINVSGLGGAVSKITVTLTNFTHSHVGDVDVLLAGPQGQAVRLMCDVGNFTNTAVNNITLTFDDNGPVLSRAAGPTSGTYRPTDYSGPDMDWNRLDIFPAPAPPSNQWTSVLAGFNGTNPNGAWQLYIVDDWSTGDNGTLAGGWSLAISTTTNFCCGGVQLPIIINPATVLAAESCTPTNGLIDPYETVTVNCTLQNVSGVASNLVATLLPGHGINSPSAPQNFGTLTTGLTATRPFSFLATGNCGDPVTAIFELTDDAGLLGVITNTFLMSGQLVSNTVTAANTDSLMIGSGGTQFYLYTRTGGVAVYGITVNPYPSTITVSNLSTAIAKVRVTLNNLTHPGVGQIDMLLVGPQGQNVRLMSDVGWTNGVTDVTLTFDDAYPPVPTHLGVPSGTYSPTDISGSSVDWGFPDVFPAPAPATPWGSALAVFNGTNPNGTWSLYMLDDYQPLDIGTLAGGWSLTIITTNLVCASCATLPAASFTGAPTNGVAPVSVTFTDDSTGTITNRYWDFGDGFATNITATSVTHTYFTSGSNTVSLLVTGPLGGDALTRTGYIVVAPSPFELWQQQYFGCTACPQAAPDADPLGKGMSNTNQFLAGLNPTNSASVFRVQDITRDTNGWFTVTWHSVGGKTYRVQYGNGTADGGYTNVFTDIPLDVPDPNPAGIPGLLQYTDDFTLTGAPPASNRYYRVRLAP